MRYAMLLLIPFFALAGCARGPSLQSQMTAYIGADTQGLVQSLGVPDKQISVNGIDYLAYRVRYSADVAAYEDAYYGFYGPYAGPSYPIWLNGPGLSPTVPAWWCEVTFLLKDGHVFNFVLRGNDCG